MGWSRVLNDAASSGELSRHPEKQILVECTAKAGRKLGKILKHVRD